MAIDKLFRQKQKPKFIQHPGIIFRDSSVACSDLLAACLLQTGRNDNGRHSGESRNPVIYKIHSRWPATGRPAGMTAKLTIPASRQNHNPFHPPAPPSWIPASAGRLRASSAACSRHCSTTYIVPSRRIQDILSINDNGVLFWLSVILSVCNRQGFSRNAGSPHLK